jgi:N-acetylmuramoyl-L-alanine amidase
MKHGDSTSLRFRRETTSGLALAGSVLLLAALFVCLPESVRAGQESAARDQFAHAVRMRTMLEGLLTRDRSVADYQKTVEAYHRVYLLSTTAPEVTPSLIAEAELYREMGRLFSTKYFESSINMYKFLLAQYPGTRYRGEALFAIAQIEKDDQKNLDAAETSFKEFLKHYPKSDRADEARHALAQISAARGASEAPAEQVATNDSAAAAQPSPAKSDAKPSAAGLQDVSHVSSAGLAALGPVLEPKSPQRSWAAVEYVEAKNAADHARIIVRLNDTVTFDSAHLSAPDRIYFDLHKTRVGSKIRGKSIDFQSGLLRSVRVGQNQPSVVRVVLDADGAKSYSAGLVGKPYRLVIDLNATSARAAERASNAADASGKDAGTGKAAEVVAVDASKAAADSLKRAEERLASTSSGAKVKPPPVPQPTHDGEHSLTRVLGLKINRIVIDAGHGGHDTGTIGPHGLMEKDVCLDVALRLGHMIEQKLPGAQVIYTRKDDTFIPLEQRTQIANDAKADLFISIHANSSRDPYARGVETYYLNFATSPEAMETATRENAYSQESMHDLQDLIKKIARNDKIEESKELATDIQDSLSHRLELVSSHERDRGVKRAPFVVLIGANMPSVLAEISFLSNPSDERLLRKASQRERIAMGLYRGIAEYLTSINSLSLNKQKFAADDHAGGNASASTTASNGPGSRD